MAKREDALIASLREDVAKARAHEHPAREDYFCLNLVAYMGERMGWVLGHIDAVEAELAEVHAEIERLKANRWSDAQKQFIEQVIP